MVIHFVYICVFLGTEIVENLNKYNLGDVIGASVSGEEVELFRSVKK